MAAGDITAQPAHQILRQAGLRSLSVPALGRAWLLCWSSVVQDGVESGGVGEVWASRP